MELVPEGARQPPAAVRYDRGKVTTVLLPLLVVCLMSEYVGPLTVRRLVALVAPVARL
jgi:hypothetical protein